MTYKLKFEKRAWREWEKLGHTIKEQFKKKLGERLQNPHVQSSTLSDVKNLYKIKLYQAGYRLVYSVNDTTITVIVVAIGKRNRNEVYNIAFIRQDKTD